MSDPQKPKRGRPQTLDAKKALKVAMRAYWSDDPADVSLNAICGMAGASKPAIYREFGSEDGLMLAALNRYADEVLSSTFDLLAQGLPLRDTLDAVIRYASQDPKMETGCLFYKMRAGKHRLGPQTLERVNEIDAAATDAFAAYLDARRARGEWDSAQTPRAMARYLVEQIGLSFAQRAAGEPPDQVHRTMSIALSVFTRSGP